MTYILLISLVWLAATYGLAFLFGSRLRHSNMVLSVVYLAALLALGGFAGIWLGAEPPDIWAAVGLGALGGEVAVWRLRGLNAFGQMAVLSSFLSAAVYLAYTLFLALFTQSNIFGFLLALLFFYLQAAAVVLLLPLVLQVFSVVCATPSKRVQTTTDPTTPNIVVLVPVDLSAPAALDTTLASLQGPNYPYYKVVVVDHGAYQIAGDHPRGASLLRLRSWQSGEASALNFACLQVAQSAEMVALVRPGTVAYPDFLRDALIPIRDANVLFAQASDDVPSRAARRLLPPWLLLNRFVTLFDERYSDTQGAARLAGDMCLLRKEGLLELGGWDASSASPYLDLSMHAATLGRSGAYFVRTEDAATTAAASSFEGAMEHAYLAAWGGMQVLKRHWLSLQPWARWIDASNHLSVRQRYSFLLNGLGPLSETLLAVFSVLLLVVGGAYQLGFLAFAEPLVTPAVAVVAAFTLVGLTRFVWGPVAAGDATLREGFAALRASYALGWSKSLGSLAGLRHRPGLDESLPVVPDQAIMFTTSVAAGSLAVAVGFFLSRPNLVSIGVAALCLWQSWLFSSAAQYSLGRLRGEARQPQGRADRTGVPMLRPRLAAGGVMLALAGLLYLRVVTPVPAMPPLQKLAEVAPLHLLDHLQSPIDAGLIHLQDATPIVPALPLVASVSGAQVSQNAASGTQTVQVAAESSVAATRQPSAPATSTQTRVIVPTAAHPATPTATARPVSTATPPGPSATASVLPATSQPTATPRSVPSVTPLREAVATATSKRVVVNPTPVPTLRPAAQPTGTPLPSPTARPSATAPRPTSTVLRAPTATRAPVRPPVPPTSTRQPAPTSTPVPLPTSTLLPRPSITPVPPATSTPVLSPVPTHTPLPVVTVPPQPTLPRPTSVPPPTQPIPTAPVPTAVVPTVPVPTQVIPPTAIVPTVVVPTIVVPTAVVPTLVVPTVPVPTVSIPTVLVPTVAVPTVPVPTVTLPPVPPVPTLTVPPLP